MCARKTTLGVYVVLLVLAIPLRGWSATITINPGQSIDNALGNMQGGDTLELTDGVYTEGIRAGRIPSGSSSNPTIVKARNRGGAILRPTNTPVAVVVIGYEYNQHWIVLDGLVLDGINNGSGPGLLTLNGSGGSNDLTIQYVEMKNMRMDNDNNAGNAAIGWGWFPETGTVNVRIHHCYIHDIGLGSWDNQTFWAYGIYGTQGTFDYNVMENIPGYAIHQYSSTGAYNNTTISNNTFRNTGTVLVNCGNGGSNHKVFNNILDGVGTTPAFFDRQGFRVCGHGTEVYNNTIVNGGRGGGEAAKSACIKFMGGGNTARNNICWHNAMDVIQQEGGGNTVDHNLVGQDPRFVNASAHDYHLQPGSPAMNAGVPMGGQAFVGSVPDIGACEGTNPCGAGSGGR
jgi:hypothetical protein